MFSKVDLMSKCLKMNQELHRKLKLRTKNSNCYDQKKTYGKRNDMTGIPYQEKLNETYSNTCNIYTKSNSLQKARFIM